MSPARGPIAQARFRLERAIPWRWASRAAASTRLVGLARFDGSTVPTRWLRRASLRLVQETSDGVCCQGSSLGLPGFSKGVSVADRTRILRRAGRVCRKISVMDSPQGARAPVHPQIRLAPTQLSPQFDWQTTANKQPGSPLPRHDHCTTHGRTRRLPSKRGAPLFHGIRVSRVSFRVSACFSPRPLGRTVAAYRTAAARLRGAALTVRGLFRGPATGRDPGAAGHRRAPGPALFTPGRGLPSPRQRCRSRPPAAAGW